MPWKERSFQERSKGGNLKETERPLKLLPGGERSNLESWERSRMPAGNGRAKLHECRISLAAEEGKGGERNRKGRVGSGDAIVRGREGSEGGW